MSKDNKPKKPSSPIAIVLPIGIALGVSLGTAFGLALDNLGLGLAVGIAIGVGLAPAFAAGMTKKKSSEQDKPSPEQPSKEDK